MAVIRWDPFREMMSMQDQMRRMFDSLWGGDTTRSWLPPVDVYDGKEEVLLKADLPGVKPDAVQVELDENVLTIRGERPSDFAPEERRYHRVERPTGSFERSIALPQGVLADRIEATFDDGILTVRIPKAEEVKPKRITVQAKKEPLTIEGKAA
jgi:HSP20 family protein